MKNYERAREKSSYDSWRSRGWREVKETDCEEMKNKMNKRKINYIKNKKLEMITRLCEKVMEIRLSQTGCVRGNARLQIKRGELGKMIQNQ